MNRRSFLRSGAAVTAITPFAAIGIAMPTQSEFFRISVEKDDPGYIPYAKLNGDGRSPKIYLDGIEQRDCITADASEGWIKRIIITEQGNPANVCGEICHEVVCGKVVIEVPPVSHRRTA